MKIAFLTRPAFRGLLFRHLLSSHAQNRENGYCYLAALEQDQVAYSRHDSIPDSFMISLTLDSTQSHENAFLNHSSCCCCR